MPPPRPRVADAAAVAPTTNGNGHAAEPRPASNKPRPASRSLVLEHFSIHPESWTLRADPMVHYPPNVQRDWHDVFNLVTLVPVIALNLANWDLSSSPASMYGDDDHYQELASDTAPSYLHTRVFADRWHGRFFDAFWWTTLLYFLVDALIVLRYPARASVSASPLCSS